MSYNPKEHLEGLERKYAAGEVAQSTYEKAKAYHLRAIENERRADAGLPPVKDPLPVRIRRGVLGVGGFLLFVWLVSTCSGGGTGGGGGVGDALRPTEAEVACERGVRNATGERPRFDHQQTTAITGGYKVYGVATWDAQAVGYICTVTGPSGRHSVTVELNP